MRRTQVGHVQRAADSVLAVGAALVVLRLQEVRLHVGPAPAACAAGGPVVVVLSLTPQVDHCVDGRRTAEAAPARLIADTASEAELRHRGKRPVARIAAHDEQRRPGGNPVQHTVIDSAGFEQRDRLTRILGQARCKNASARTTTDHDVVEFHYAPCCVRRCERSFRSGIVARAWCGRGRSSRTAPRIAWRIAARKVSAGRPVGS